MLGRFFFEEPCPVSGRKKCTVTADWCLTLLREYVMPTLKERLALSGVTFMQNSAHPHIARDIKTYLLETLTEDRVISRGCKIQ